MAVVACHPNKMARYRLVHGDAVQALSRLERGSIALTVTSPPYYKLKDYRVPGQRGWEPAVDKYVAYMELVLEQLRLVTTERGSCFLVIGDTYGNGSLLLVPHRLALAAQRLGWVVRNDLIWSKLDAPPERPAARWRCAYEHVLFLTKRRRGYTFHIDEIRVPYSPATVRRWGRGQAYGGPKADVGGGPEGHRFRPGRTFRLNKSGAVAKDVIELPTARSRRRHYATFPEALVELMVLAASDAGDLVLDPFTGTSTTGAVALKHGRRFLGIDISSEYLAESERRLSAIAAGDGLA